MFRGTLLDTLFSSFSTKPFSTLAIPLPRCYTRRWHPLPLCKKGDALAVALSNTSHGMGAFGSGGGHAPQFYL